MHGRLLTLSAGGAHSLPQQGRMVKTAIGKRPIASAELTVTGVPGDIQVDTAHHGGVYRALCLYPDEHYAHWERTLGRALARPGFGENFTTSGLVETDVCIGDIFRVGEARVQVTQPRGPCNTLAAFVGEPQLAAWAIETGYTGWYMSVITGGSVRAGDAMELDARPGTGVTIEDCNRARWPRDAREAALAERVLAEPLLRDEWPDRVRASAALQRAFV